MLLQPTQAASSYRPPADHTLADQELYNQALAVPHDIPAASGKAMDATAAMRKSPVHIPDAKRSTEPNSTARVKFNFAELPHDISGAKCADNTSASSDRRLEAGKSTKPPNGMVMIAVPGEHSRKPQLAQMLKHYLPSSPRCLEVRHTRCAVS